MTSEKLELMLTSHKSQSLGAGADEAEIRSAETALGVRIHGSYRDFLSRFGWGGAGSVELYGLGSDVPHHLDLVEVTLSERTEMNPRLPAHLLPIMNDGAGNLYCIDTITKPEGEPSIVLWSHECGPEQVPESVAEGFDSWLIALLDGDEAG